MPLKGSDQLLSPFALVTVSRPGTAPVVVGMKETCKGQLALGASAPGHVFVTAKPLDAVTGPSCTVAPPEFCTVTDCVAVPWMTVAPKTTGSGVNDKAPGVTPVPSSPAVAELPLPHGRVRLPGKSPVAAGEKITWIVQLPPALNVAPQPFPPRRKPAPLTNGVPSDTASPPLFVAVNACVAEALSTTAPKLTLAGENATLPGRTPVPLSGSDALAGAPLLVIVSTPVRLPVVVGENTTLRVQEPPPAASCVEGVQLLPGPTAKSPVSPVMVIAENWTEVPPWFVTVAELVALPPVAVALKEIEVGEKTS